MASFIRSTPVIFFERRFGQHKILVDGAACDKAQ